MASVNELLLLVRGDASGALRALNEVANKVRETEEKSKGFGGFLGGLGKIAGAAAAATVIGGLTVAIKSGFDAYKNLESAQARLDSAMSAWGLKTTPAVTATIKNNVAEMRKLGVGQIEVTNSMATLTEAHIPLNKQLNVMKTAANLAAAGTADGDHSLAGALKAVLLGAQGTGRALRQYGINLPPAIASTKQLKSAEEELAKAKEALSRAQEGGGVSAAKAQEQSERLAIAEAKYQDALSRYPANSTQVASALLAVQRARDAANNAGAAGGKKLSDAEAKVAEAQKKVNDYTKQQKDHFRNLDPALASINQRFKDQASGQMKGLPGMLKAMSLAWEDIAIAVGRKVEPVFTAIGKWFTDNQDTIQSFITTTLDVLGTAFSVIGSVLGTVIGVLTNLWQNVIVPFSPVFEAFVATWAAFKAYAIGGEIVSFLVGLPSMITGVAMGFAALDLSMLPIAALLAAIILAGILLVKNWDAVKRGAQRAWGFILSVIHNVWNWIKQNWPLILTIIAGPIGMAVAFVIQHFNQIKKIFGDVVHFIGEKVGDVVSFFQKLPGRIWDVIKNLWSNWVVKPFNQLKQGISGIVDDIVEFFRQLPGRIADFIKGIPGAVNDMVKGIPIIGNIVGAGESVIGGIGNFIGGLASGGDAAAGSVAWTGEKGPELIRFGANAHVFPTGFVQKAIASMSAQGQGQTNVVVNHPASEFDAVQMIEHQRYLDRLANRGVGLPALSPRRAHG